MPEQALGESQHEAAVAWRDLGKWKALKKKEHLGFLAEVTEEEHIRPDVFRGGREVFVPEYEGLRSPSVWCIQASSPTCRGPPRWLWEKRTHLMRTN